MRTILVAGEGEAEKTAAAAATAWGCAAAGHDTLLLSSRTGGLREFFEGGLDGEPRKVGPRLWASEADVMGDVRRYWPAGWRYLQRLAAWARRRPEEMLDSLGIEATSAFMQLGQAEGFDALVFDCHLSPRDTARLVRGFGEFDDGMRRYYQPVRRFVLPPLRLGLALGGLRFPLPDESVLRELERAQVRARQTFRRLRSERCAARVVVPAGRRFPLGFEVLNDLRPDLVVVAGGPPSREFQREMKRVFPDLPAVRLPDADGEGLSDVAKRLYGGRDPLRPAPKSKS